MSPGVFLSVHWWRGCGLDRQLDLFHFALRLGVVTIGVEREPLLAAYRRLREAVATRVAHDERKRREKEDSRQ